MVSEPVMTRVVGNAPRSYKVDCECGWSGYARTPEQARSDYDEHRGTDPRHEHSCDSWAERNPGQQERGEVLYDSFGYPYCPACDDEVADGV